MHYVLLIGEIASVVTPIQATTSSEDSNLVVPHKETQSESEFTFRETVFVQKGVHIPPRDIKLGKITYNYDLWLI